METATAIPSERYYYRFEDPNESDDVAQFAADGIVLPSIDNYIEKSAKRPRRFDWIMGVFLPLVCFYFDPIVFTNWSGTDAMLATVKVPAYSIAFLAIMAHTAWLLWGESVGKWRYVIAGILYPSAVLSMIVGAILFPFSLLGLIILVGILGFTPFFTAKAYLRSANQAMFAGKGNVL